jgi:hypothetical protein
MAREVDIFIPFKAREETMRLIFRQIMVDEKGKKGEPLTIREAFEYLISKGFIRSWNFTDLKDKPIPISLDALEEMDISDANFVLETVQAKLLNQDLPKG